MNSILLIHGGALNQRMWVQQIEALNDDFDVHTIDLPGHGVSINTPFTIDTAVNEIHEYINKTIGSNTAIVGSSLGGYVAIAYAHKYPRNVSKLILSGCCIQYVGLMGLLAKINITLLKIVGKKRFSAMQKRALMKITSKSVSNSIYDGGISLRGARESMAEVIGKDFMHMIGQCKAPILLVNGEKDILNKKYEARYAKVANHLSIKSIDNCGHLCNLEKPDIFTQEVSQFAKKSFRNKSLESTSLV